jgi:hypothetical protein
MAEDIKKASRGYDRPPGDFIEAFSGNPFSSITPKAEVELGRSGFETLRFDKSLLILSGKFNKNYGG